MSRKSPTVTLILGNHPIAEHAAIRARNKGHKVVLGLDGPPSLDSDASPLDARDYNSYLNLFQTTLESYLGIDKIILAFTPLPRTQTQNDSYIPGTNPEVFDDIVHPLMKSLKNVWYNWKRDDRYAGKRDIRKLTIFALEGYDIETKTCRNAILGFWRCIIARTGFIGPQTDLVIADLRDESNFEATIDALLSRPSSEPSVHIVENGRTTSQSHLVGQCSSLSIQTLGGRLLPLLWLKEKTDKIGIQLKKQLNPPSSAPVVDQVNAALLRSGPMLVAAYLAFTSYQAARPMAAFVFGLIASSLSVIGGSALITIAASEVILA